MLSFNMRRGDDVYFGPMAAPLEQFQPLIIKDVTDDGLVVLTPTEEIEVPFNDELVDLGFLGVKVTALEDDQDPYAFTISFDAPNHVRVLRGRVYRRELI